MISTQKIIVMGVMLNIIIGIILSMNANMEGDYRTSVDEEIGNIEQEQNSFTSDEGLWGSVKAKASQVYESTIGNVNKWGAGIFNILGKALNPWSINRNASYCTDELTKILADALCIIRTLIIPIVILEIYLVFKNKKAT